MDETIGVIRERVALADSKAKAAHERLDRLEVVIREDIKEIGRDIEGIGEKFDRAAKEAEKEIDKLKEWMHQTRGKFTAAYFFVGLFGAALVKLIDFLFSKI